jgi:O-antigen/teichoic acid export membrane protein
MLARRDMLWGYAAQALNVGAGLILLPIIVLYLEPEQVGLWFVFLTIAGLALLMEQGFQPTISRNVAYVHAGAQDLSPSGLAAGDTGEFKPQLLSDLLAASRWLYRRIAGAAAVLLLTVGSAYVWTLVATSEARLWAMVAWLTFCLGNLLNFYFGYLNAFLHGRGDLVQSNQVIICARLTNLVVGAAALAAGAGLLGLGLATLVSAVASRWLAAHHLKARAAAQPSSPTSRERRDQLVKVIWHNASRFGIVLLGLFMTTRANVLIASSGLGLAAAAGYGLTVQLLLVLQALASVPLNLALPGLNALRVQARRDELYRRFGLTLALGLSIGAAGSVALVLLGAPVLAAIGSRTTLPQTGVVALMALVFLLELNHGICANLISTSNTVSFAKAYLVTGCAIVLLSAFFVHWTGLLGLVLINLLCQLAYNNWRWPQVVAADFGIPYTRLIHDGFRSLRKG